jgi:hypothetical protein
MVLLGTLLLVLVVAVRRLTRPGRVATARAAHPADGGAGR